MNDRDRAIGRLLLQKGLIGQPVLVQAGQTTMQRRQAGQNVEVLAVLVEMGAITREVASTVWQEAAGNGPAAAAQPPGPPARVNDSGESFDPTGDLGSMGAPPPADVLGFQPPPSRPSAPAQDFATDAPTLVGNLGVPPGMGSGNFGAPPPGTGQFGSGAFGAGGAAAFGTNNFGSGSFGGPAPGGGFGSGSFGGPGGSAAFGGPGGATLPPSNLGSGTGGGSAFGAGPGSAFGTGFGNAGGGGSAFGAAGGAFGGDTGFGGNAGGAVAPPPTGGTGGGFGGGAGFGGGGGFGAPPADTGGGFGGGGGGFGAPPADTGGGFGAPVATGGGGFGGPVDDDDDDEPAPRKTSSRSTKRGKSSRRSASEKGRRSISERSALRPRKQKNLPLIVGLSAVVVVLLVAIVVVITGGDKDPPPVAKTGEGDGTTPGKTGDLPTTPGVTPTQRPRPTGKPKPAADPLKVKPSPLFDEPKTPLNQADKDKRSMEAQESYSLRAAEFYDIERYDRAEQYLGKVLEIWPKWFRDSTGYRKLAKEQRGYRKMDKFKRRLEDVLKEGAGSANFKKWIQRLESRELKDRQPDLAELPCVERYRKKAEDILGTEAYHEAAEVFEDVEKLFDLKSEGLEDSDVD